MGKPQDRKRIVRSLLDLLDGQRGVCVISTAVLEEVTAASLAVQDAIHRGFKHCPPELFFVTDYVKFLALGYISAGILPAQRRLDALHIAAATCHGHDFLVSWDHRHLTRPTKKLQFETLAKTRGFLKTPQICNPLEARDELRAR